jgi:hypothetical protein
LARQWWLLLPPSLLYLQGTNNKRREKEWGVKKRGIKKMKMKNNKRGGLMIKLRAFLLCFLNTSKL